MLEKGTGRLMWEEYTQQPATGERAEIVDGEMVPSAGASLAHQPDVLYLRYEKGGSAEVFRSLIRLEVAPDPVVEVLSSSGTLESLQAKLQDHHLLGVPEV